jgi:hypothetical protein
MWGKDDRLRKPFCALCHVARETGFCESVGDRRKRLRHVDFCPAGCRFAQSALKTTGVSGYLCCRLCKNRAAQTAAFPDKTQRSDSPGRIRARPGFPSSPVMSATAGSGAAARTDATPFHLRMTDRGRFNRPFRLRESMGFIRDKDIAPGNRR